MTDVASDQVELVEDRCFRSPSGAVRDLVTGRPVTIRRPTVGGEVAGRWSDECEERSRRRLAGEPPLLDYGWSADGRAFEIVESHTVLRPEAGRRAGVPMWRGDHVLQPRRAERILVELIDEPPARRVRLVHLHGPPGAGVRTTLLLVARALRTRGVIALGAPVFARWPHVRRLLRDRSVAVIVPGPPAAGAAGAPVDLLLSGSSPVAVLCASRAASASGGLPLDPVPVERLVAMCPGLDIDRAVVIRCAEASRGWPGVFLRLLAAEGVEASYGASSFGRAHDRDRVAESGARYRRGSASPGAVGIRGPSASVPVEVARATALAARGRRAAAARQLRATATARRRRGAVTAAAAAYLALVHLVRENGDSAAAYRAARQAAGCGQDAGDPQVLARAAWCLGLTAIDIGRLVEAERWLGASMVASTLVDDTGLANEARLGLARCLFERGRAGEAAGFARLVVQEGGAAQRSAAHRRLARIALDEGAVASAGAEAARALRSADEAGDRGARHAARVTAARVQVAIGDLGCAGHHLEQALREACTPRQRHEVLRLRATLSRGRRTSADPGGASDVFAGRRRPGSRVVGGTDRPTADSLRGEGRVESVRRRDDATGLESYREISEVLEICHESDDELPALRRVCALVRERLGAAAVGVYAERASGALIAAGREGPEEAALAQRAIQTGLPVPLSRLAGGLAAASPVRYGGVTFAALFSRWRPDAAIDQPRVDTVLLAVSTASAPHVRAALDRMALQPPSERRTDLGLLGGSSEAERLRELVRRAAPVPFPALVVGESGSGKELVARALHDHGPRRLGPFCAINCAALPDDLLEAELFGFARGAFTGAVAERAGMFEAARRGTLFLDEVSELSARAQAKLLRVMQEREVRRLGETMSRPVDVRIVSATNRPLDAEARAGRFRQDLLYRLDVVRVPVPPLRDRPGDVPLLAARFWQDATALVGSRATLDPQTVAALCRYPWPGNVRELQNVVATLAVQAPRRGRVGPGRLPAWMLEAATDRQSLREARERFERRFIEAALVRTRGSLTAAARELGMSRQGLTKLAARLGVGSADERPDVTAAVHDRGGS